MTQQPNSPLLLVSSLDCVWESHSSLLSFWSLSIVAWLLKKRKKKKEGAQFMNLFQQHHQEVSRRNGGSDWFHLQYCESHPSSPVHLCPQKVLLIKQWTMIQQVRNHMEKRMHLFCINQLLNWLIAKNIMTFIYSWFLSSY